MTLLVCACERIVRRRSHSPATACSDGRAATCSRPVRVCGKRGQQPVLARSASVPTAHLVHGGRHDLHGLPRRRLEEWPHDRIRRSERRALGPSVTQKLWAVPADASSPARQITPDLQPGQWLARASAVSPDGRWVVYGINQGGGLGDWTYHLADLRPGGTSTPVPLPRCPDHLG